MEQTGRSYFFLAAALILLAASIHGYDKWLANDVGPTQVVTKAQADAACDAKAIISQRLRIECQTGPRDQRVRDMTQRGGSSARDEPKMIQMQNN